MREQRFRKYYEKTKKVVQEQKSQGVNPGRLKLKMIAEVCAIPNRTFTGAQLQKLFDLTKREIQTEERPEEGSEGN